MFKFVLYADKNAYFFIIHVQVFLDSSTNLFNFVLYTDKNAYFIYHTRPGLFRFKHYDPLLLLLWSPIVEIK